MTENLTSAGHFAAAFCTAPAVSSSDVSFSGHLCDDNCLYCWGPETD